MGFKVRKKACPVCGAEFETAKPNKKYCSISCREAGTMARRLQWETENKSYQADYMRKYRAEQNQKKETKQDNKATQARTARKGK